MPTARLLRVISEKDKCLAKFRITKVMMGWSIGEMFGSER
jgi:hypothetical protein